MKKIYIVIIAIGVLIVAGLGISTAVSRLSAITSGEKAVKVGSALNHGTSYITVEKKDKYKKTQKQYSFTNYIDSERMAVNITNINGLEPKLQELLFIGDKNIAAEYNCLKAIADGNTENNEQGGSLFVKIGSSTEASAFKNFSVLCGGFCDFYQYVFKNMEEQQTKDAFEIAVNDEASKKQLLDCIELFRNEQQEKYVAAFDGLNLMTYSDFPYNIFSDAYTESENRIDFLFNSFKDYIKTADSITCSVSYRQDKKDESSYEQKITIQYDNEENMEIAYSFQENKNITIRDLENISEDTAQISDILKMVLK